MVLSGTSLLSIRNYTEKHISTALNLVHNHLEQLDDEELKKLGYRSTFSIPNHNLGVFCSWEHVVRQTFGDACIFFNIFNMEDYKQVLVNEENSKKISNTGNHKSDPQKRETILNEREYSSSAYSYQKSEHDIIIDPENTFSVTFLNKTNKDIIELISSLKENFDDSLSVLRELYSANYDIKIDQNITCYIERFDIGNLFLTIKADYSEWSPWDLVEPY